MVVSAGKGGRAGGLCPKQYQKVAGKMVLRWTLEHLLRISAVDDILVVIHPDHELLYSEATNGLNIFPPVYGGVERQESVRLGLEQLKSLAPQNVLIHDAARPIINAEVVNNLLSALEEGFDGALPGLPITDTIKRTTTDATIKATVDRQNLWCAQTPQCFKFHAIQQAHSLSEATTITDDAALMEALGGRIKVVDGSKKLFKITTPEDFTMFEQMITPNMPDVRTGLGFDVHKFESGSSITLGGVNIPHAAKLKGHSDADTLLHAITDAILGAIGEGDIGDHFPPSDPQWKDMESDVFLRHAASLLKNEYHGVISHVDTTIMCESPKIGPHRNRIRQSIAEILNLPIGRVSVKATTTEKLGFTGRQEGIAAQAITTVRLPLSKIENN